MRWTWMIGMLVVTTLACSTSDAATRSRHHRRTTHAAATSSKKPATQSSGTGTHAPVLAVQPLPVPALPPSAGKEVTPDDIAEQQQELDRMRDEARRNREAAARVRGREKSVAKDLQRVERDLTTTTRYLQQLDARSHIVAGQRQITERNLADAVTRREAQRHTLAWRLREVYKFGSDRRFEALISSRSFPELLERTDFFARILAADRTLLASINAETVRIDDHRRSLVATGNQLTQIASEQKVETRRLATLKTQRVATIASLKSERQVYEETAAEMEASARRIQTIIAALERRRRQQEAAARAAQQAGKPPPAPEDTWLLNADFAKNKGALPWPVHGDVVTQFGRSINPRFNTVTINNGIDVSAAAGTDIRVVAKGRVELVDNLPGYGRTIIVNHGGGYYTIYGHCADTLVTQDATVDAGQVIARVGQTDSLKGPTLHFEIRQGKSAVNPSGWLK